MAEEQAPDSIPPRMSDHLPNLASMRDPELLELVWENGQILIRGLSSKITEKSCPSSGYVSQSSKAPIQRERETSTAKRSKDGDVDSMFGNPLSGFSGLTKLDLHERNKKNSLQTCQELLSELYEDGFNDALVPEKECYDKQLIDSNQSYVSKLVEEIPRQTVNSNSEVPQSSLKQYEGSIQFMRSKEKKSRVDEQSGRVNFSTFLRTPALHKPNHPRSGATRPTSSPGLAGAEDLEGNARSSSRRRNPFDMTQVERTDCSTNIRSAEKEGNFTARNMKPILPDSEPQKESLPDEQSEAVGYKDTRSPNKVHGPSPSLAPNTAINGNPGNRKSVEQMVASSSVCSREASNCPIYTLKGIPEEDTDLSENEMEESEGTIKAAPARGRKGVKRKRKTDVHNLSERRRRDKINKKMRALQELIPNCNKVDKASMLDEAIEYLKTLQLQVKMMSMGNGVYMPPMMLPSALQHMNAQNFAGYSPMAVGMGMRMQMGLGCGPAQFPTSLMSGDAALPGNPEARLNMLGFPGQGLLMSMSRSPFASLAERFSPQSVQPPGVSQAAAAQVEVPGAAAPLSTSKDSNPAH